MLDLASAAIDDASAEDEERVHALRVTLEGKTSLPLARDPEGLLAELRGRALGRPVYVEKLRFATQRHDERGAHPLEPYLVQVAAELGAEATLLLGELPTEIADEVRLLLGEDERLVGDALRYVSSKLQGGD
ncbi:hypothetical protein EON77_18445 [bacterium]|nr:MAG: hypothetical protein EON77_18445 [bacterium]